MSPSPSFLWITGRWWSVWWSRYPVSPRWHTAPSPGNTRQISCYEPTGNAHINTHLLSWHQGLCEGSPCRSGQWCAWPVPGGTRYRISQKRTAPTPHRQLDKRTCSNRWYLRTLCMGTMSKSLREKRPLFALFEHSWQIKERGSC